MVALDMKTVMLANVIIGFIGMVVMFMLWYQNHNKYSGIAYWVLDWILLTGGMALISLQGNIPPWESIILSNSMIVGGMAILYFGLRLFAGKKSSPWLISSILVVFAAFVVVHSYYTYVQADLLARSLNAAGGLLLGCLVGMWLLFKEVSPQIRRISTGTGIALGIIALICIIRIFGFSLLPQTGNQFLLSGKFDTMMVMLLTGAIVFLVFNLVLMVNRRLYLETEDLGDIVSRNALELQAVFKTTSVGFGIMVNRVFKEVNEAYCRLIGYSREELIGQKTRMVYPTDEEYLAVGQLYSKVEELGAVTTETRLVRKDGVIVNAIMNIAAFDKNDLNKGTIFSITDITERKQEENILQRYKVLAEYSRDIILFMEADSGRILEANIAAEKAYGYRRNELLNLGIHDLRGPEKRDLIEKQMVEANRNGILFETVHKRKDGSIFPVEVSSRGETIGGVRTLISIVRDITERKQAENQISENESKYRALFTTMAEGAALHEITYSAAGKAENYRILEVNPAFEIQTGVKGENVRGHLATEAYQTDIPPYFEIYEKVARTGEPYSFETYFQPLNKYFAISVYSPKPGWFATVFTNITERKKAEEDLRQSEEKYRLIVEETLDLIFTTNSREEFAYVSPSVKSILGYNPSELIGKQFISLVHPQDKLAMTEEIKRSYTNGYNASMENEYRLRHSSGEWRWVISKGARVVDTKGDFLYFIGIIKDITARKQAEAALKQSEQNLRNSMDSSVVGIYIVNKYANKAFFDIFGYRDMEDVKAKPPHEHYTPESYSAYLRRGEQLSHGEPTPDSFEIDIIRKDGAVRHLQVSRSEVFWDGERRRQVFFHDITERKQAEDALRLTEQNLRNSIDRSFIGTYILNIDQDTVYVNKAFMDIFGYKNIEEVKNGPPHTHFTPESYAKWALRHEKLMQGTHYPDNYEADIIQKDGAIRHLQVYRQDVFWDGKMRYQVLYHDITERKQAEEALKESESRFHELYENSPIGLYRTTLDGRILMANPALIEMLGYSDFAELSNRNLDNGVFEPSYPRKQFIENIEKNGVIQGYEYTWKRKNGTSIQVRENARATRDAKGNILYFDGTVENITERKQAEEALRESEARYKTLFESAAEGIMIADILTREQKYANPAICKMLGYTQEELTKMKINDIHPPGLRDFAAAEFEAQVRGEKTTVSLPCLRKDGTIIYMDINAVKTFIDGRECAVGFFTDITARKQAEDALKASEEKYSTLVEKSGDGIIILDNRTVTFANQKMEEMTGYHGSELYGKIFTDLIAPEYKAMLDEGYQKRQANSVGTPASYEVELLTKDGRKIPVDTKANRILLESRYIVMVTIRDVTERKLAEEKILASLAEKETLLKEVHHRVKNNMQVISSLLRLQEGRVKDKDAAALLKDSQNRIQSMALVYNKLYQSENLASVNMTDYIKELSAGLVKSYAVSPARVAVNVAQSNVFLNVDSAIPCGMIINELVTNSLKYAFPDNRKGRITISLTEEEQGLQLTVGDDGVGIPADVSLANNSTLGIKLVSNLVRDQLGGTIELDRGHGTAYRINFPRNKEEK